MTTTKSWCLDPAGVARGMFKEKERRSEKKQWRIEGVQKHENEKQPQSTTNKVNDELKGWFKDNNGQLKRSELDI